MKIALLLILAGAFCVSAQRITTIQLDGVQYFVSRMNPYSPELNYFLAYQYCRSLGLQLASFETKEKADTMTQYLKNAGYTKYDFWTSGNKLGTDMFLWMSTGLPFNATFDYMLKRPGNRPIDVPPGTEPQRVARESADSGSADGCVAMMAPTLAWESADCTHVKDFICEQTRCYYYNYGSIPVSATQGNRRPYITTTAAPTETIREEEESERKTEAAEEKLATAPRAEESSESDAPTDEVAEERSLEKNPVLKRLVSPVASPRQDTKASRPEHLPDLTSLFADTPVVRPAKDNIFEGLETHEIRSLSRAASPSVVLSVEHRQESIDYEEHQETEAPNNALEEARTIGPYDSSGQDYQADQADLAAPSKELDDDSSTVLPVHDPANNRYTIKVRDNGKVLDPPSN